MKKYEGITLIALVITIIVLLILAGITIATLTGENGLLQRAEEAAQKTKEGAAKEEITLAWAACYTDYQSGELSEEDAFSKNNMNTHLGDTGEVTEFVYNKSGISVVTYTNQDGDYCFEIDSTGNITGGNGSSVDNAKVQELFNKGWSVGATSSGYIAADYTNMKLYTLDASFNTVSEETLTPSDGSLFTLTDGKITATTATTGVVIVPNTINNVNVTGIAANSFKGKTGITKIILPPSVTTIDSSSSASTGAFYNCTGLVNVAYSKNLTTIGNNAFYSCSKIDSIEFPDTMTTIGTSAFYGCKLINRVRIPTSLSTLSTNVFYNCSKISEIRIPKNITSIAGGAFYGCSGINSIVVEEGNTVYDSRNNCNAIIITASNKLILGCKSTVMPDNVTAIDQNSFAGATGLTNVNDLLTHVTSIGNYAFCNCTGITSVNIPTNVTTIGANPFYGCTGITSITVASGNTVYDSRDNCNAIVKKSSNAIISACKNTSIKSTITTIEQHAFRQQTGITSITIPTNVTSIGNYAFYGCSGLTSLTIPTSISTIGSYTFSYCSKLTTIDIPSNITKIDSYAFQNCSQVTSVYVHGSSLATVNTGAFNNLKASSTIYVGNSTIQALFTSTRYTSSRTTISVDSSLLTQ